jgi:hexosaminidase
VLNVADDTVTFIRHVWDEVADVFPFKYTHIGGDEVPLDEWQQSADAASRVATAGLSGVEDLSGWWSRQLGRHLAGLGKRSAVWDDVLEHGPPNGAVVFAWQGVDRVQQALDAGFDVVAAPYEHTYLDWAETADGDEPLSIGGVLPLRKVYDYEPPPAVLGVQAQLWSEYLPTPELVEWRAFPRLAALAEVAWCSGSRDFDGFRHRLRAHTMLLNRLGVTHRPFDL